MAEFSIFLEEHLKKNQGLTFYLFYLIISIGLISYKLSLLSLRQNLVFLFTLLEKKLLSNKAEGK